MSSQHHQKLPHPRMIECLAKYFGDVQLYTLPHICLSCWSDCQTKDKWCWCSNTRELHTSERTIVPFFVWATFHGVAKVWCGEYLCGECCTIVNESEKRKGTPEMMSNVMTGWEIMKPPEGREDTCGSCDPYTHSFASQSQGHSGWHSSEPWDCMHGGQSWVSISVIRIACLNYNAFVHPVCLT